MLRRSWYFVGFAAVLAPLLAAGPAIAAPSGNTQPLPSAGSKPPAQVAVVPAAQPTNPLMDILEVAGDTGFLHHVNGSGMVWTRYADGSATAVSDLNDLSGRIYSAGGDVAYTLSYVNARPAAGKVTVVDFADGRWYQWAPPTGYTARAMYGTSTMLVSGTESGLQVLRLVTFAADGTSTSRLVTGVPTGTGVVVALPEPLANNGAYGVVEYRTQSPYPATAGHAVLDVATGVATPFPNETAGVTNDFLISKTSVAWYPATTTTTVHVFSISGLTSGTNTTSRNVPLSPGVGYWLQLAGDDHLILSGDGSTARPAQDVPVNGGPATALLPTTQTGVTSILATNGAPLAIGGAGSGDWAVHRYTEGSDGALVDHTVFSLARTLTNAGVSLSHGMLRHLTAVTAPVADPSFHLQNHALRPDSTAIFPQDEGGWLNPAADTCATGIRCLRTIDGNSYGMVYLATASDGTIVVEARIDGSASFQSMALPARGGQLIDVSPGYVVVNASSPATQYVVDLGHETVVRSAPAAAGALWYSTLWTTNGKAGQLIAVNLATGSTMQTVNTGTACVPTELQATGRWLYWSCGASGAHGVYDTVAGGPVPLPTVKGPALLGDGYLAWHDTAAGALKMVDFHNWQAVPTNVVIPGRPAESGSALTVVTLASLPAGVVADDRNIDWALDKFGGDLAYVTADDAVHVLDTGVPPAPTTIGDSSLNLYVYPRDTSGTNGFRAYFWIARPVSAWKVTFTRDVGGETVATTSGGAARDAIFTSWNGSAPDGYAIDGGYHWHLNVLPAGSSTWQVAGTGALYAYCGRAPYRSYGCLGMPALLAVLGGYGEAHWYEGQFDGSLRDNGYTENWWLGSTAAQFDTVLPFGDDTGDGLPDVLARDGSGVLHLYQGIGQAYFNQATVTAVTIGTGWQGYTLAYAGELNQDVYADLLARDPSGNLWLYAGAGNGSVRPRVLVGSGWNIYSRLIGAGDLNGDGVGDLLALDASGALWRYQGNGHGGLSPRSLVGTGWGIFNAIIGIGDVNQDGHNDLVARDGAGNLWEYPGDGTGGFKARTLLGTGFQKYQALF